MLKNEAKNFWKLIFFIFHKMAPNSFYEFKIDTKPLCDTTGVFKTQFWIYTSILSNFFEELLLCEKPKESKKLINHADGKKAKKNLIFLNYVFQFHVILNFTSANSKSSLTNWSCFLFKTKQWHRKGVKHTSQYTRIH